MSDDAKDNVIPIGGATATEPAPAEKPQEKEPPPPWAGKVCHRTITPASGRIVARYPEHYSAEDIDNLQTAIEAHRQDGEDLIVPQGVEIRDVAGGQQCLGTDCALGMLLPNQPAKDGTRTFRFACADVIEKMHQREISNALYQLAQITGTLIEQKQNGSKIVNPFERGF